MSLEEKTDNKKNEQNIKGSELTGVQKLNDFLQKNRKFLFVGLIALAVIITGTIVIISVQEKMQIDAFVKVDQLNLRYEELQSYIVDNEAEMSSETEAKQTEIDTLLADLKAFQTKNSGYAAARTYSMSAGIYEARKNWEEAEKAWTSAAKAAEKTYFAPICLFHAAVAAEEHGNTESAINLYTQVMNYDNAFAVAARSQFSVGRLEESRNNTSAALEAYNNLLNKWPDDPLWINLAQNRILVLSK